MLSTSQLSPEYFDSFSHEIESKFRRISHLIKHGTSIGDYHEEVLRTILRNFLPKRYSVKKGFIHKSNDEVSRQIDIMIVDENTPAGYLFQEGDFAIVRPNSVVAVMEVKTKLDINEFNKALDNIASAKALIEGTPTVPGIVFAFHGTNPTDKILDKWFNGKVASTYADRFTLCPECIMFFSHKTLLTKHDEIGWNVLPLQGQHYRRVYLNDDTGLSSSDMGFKLSMILTTIAFACEMRDHLVNLNVPVTNSSVLITQGDTRRDLFGFRPGVGIEYYTQ